VALGTFERYEEYVRVHAIPALGRIRLGRLTPQHFQRLYQDKLAAGLSPTTVSHLHTVLHGAFAEAVRWGLLSRNVVALARPPRKVHVEVVALTVEEARALLAAAAGTRFEVLFVLALKTGMRRGELLALRWEDVDLDKGVLQVRGTLRRTREGLRIGTPKTAAARRKVVLSPSSVAALGRHRARQQQERQAAGDLWQDFGLVFPNTLGRPMEPRCLLSDVYRPLLERAGLPPITFHTLRHTAATLLLAEGEHPKVVQELLGHAQVSITLDCTARGRPVPLPTAYSCRRHPRSGVACSRGWQVPGRQLAWPSRLHPRAWPLWSWGSCGWRGSPVRCGCWRPAGRKRLTPRRGPAEGSRPSRPAAPATRTNLQTALLSCPPLLLSE
jgi:integrase